jgi:hypothetical protein
VLFVDKALHWLLAREFSLAKCEHQLNLNFSDDHKLAGSVSEPVWIGFIRTHMVRFSSFHGRIWSKFRY